MQFSQKGLVIRETKTKDNDKMLTLLTAEHGKMSVYARGVRSYKSKYMHASSLLAYSSFVLKRTGDFITLCEATELASFLGAQYDLALWALCQYVADVANELTLPDQPEEAMLALTLNTLWALCNTTEPRERIKAAFELRAMSEAGFMPDIGGCGVCGATVSEMYLDIMNAQIFCPGCRGDDEAREENNIELGLATIVRRVSADELSAMRYIASAPPKRIFSFRLDDEQTRSLSETTEKYLLNHLGRGFATLDFYKETSRLG